MGLSTPKTVFKTQIDTFTSTGIGTIVDVTDNPISQFTLLVRATGAVSAWNVILEGSLDGTNFSYITTHTQIMGTGATVFPGTNSSPCLYFRTRCTILTLGLGTNIIVTILGTK